LQKISSEVLIEIISADLELVVKYCVEGKVSTRTVADNDGTSAKTWEKIAKRSRMMANVRRTAATRRVRRWQIRTVPGAGDRHQRPTEERGGQID
jgi:hypothetical protein